MVDTKGEKISTEVYIKKYNEDTTSKGTKTSLVFKGVDTTRELAFMLKVNGSVENVNKFLADMKSAGNVESCISIDMFVAKDLNDVKNDISKKAEDDKQKKITDYL